MIDNQGLQDENSSLWTENDSLRQVCFLVLAWIRHDKDSAIQSLPQSEIEAMMEAVLYDGLHAQEV